MHRSSSSATLAAFGCTIVLSAAALFAAGALLCTYTGRKWWWSGARQVGQHLLDVCLRDATVLSSASCLRGAG
jgi:hypothetical protein